MVNKPEILDYISKPFKIIVSILSLVLAIVLALSIALYWPNTLANWAVMVFGMVISVVIFMVVYTFFKLIQLTCYLAPLAFKSVRGDRTVNEVLEAMAEEK